MADDGFDVRVEMLSLSVFIIAFPGKSADCGLVRLELHALQVDVDCCRTSGSIDKLHDDAPRLTVAESRHGFCTAYYIIYIGVTTVLAEKLLHVVIDRRINIGFIKVDEVGIPLRITDTGHQGGV